MNTLSLETIKERVHGAIPCLKSEYVDAIAVMLSGRSELYTTVDAIMKTAPILTRRQAVRIRDAVCFGNQSATKVKRTTKRSEYSAACLEISKRIAVRLADKMARGNIKQATVAREFGIDETTLSRKMQGKSNFTVLDLVRAADFLGVYPDELIYGKVGE